MKMTALKPIYLNSDVVLAGQEFDTLEQHGRELIKKGYAEAVLEAPAPAVDTEPAAVDPAPETDAQTEALAPAADTDVKVDTAAKAKTK